MGVGVSQIIYHDGAIDQPSIDVICIIETPAAAPDRAASIVCLYHSVCCQAGEFESVVQSSRQQQAICTTAKSQPPDLFAVDGDVLTALQVGHAHHLHTAARNKSGLWRRLRYHETAQRVTVRHHSAVPSLRHHKNLLQVVLALALAGGEAAWEAGAGAARLFRSTDIVLSHQSLQLLQRKESSESFNALLEM